MIISIHQPQYLPWLGFFDKIDKSDCFVFLDNVQYKKREFQNRNKIRTKDGWMWLTVPVISKGRYTQKIKDVCIDNSFDWGLSHLRSIKVNYGRAKFFNTYINFFEKLYTKQWIKLVDLNIVIIREILAYLGIQKKSYLESGLLVVSSKTSRIIDICKNVGADVYLSGRGGKDYLDEKQFKKNIIALRYQDFVHPTYRQCREKFIPEMSIIDLLFNHGPDSLKVLRKRA